jgi:hypothetical protein
MTMPVVERLRRKEPHVIKLTKTQLAKYESDERARGRWQTRAESEANKRSQDVYLTTPDGKRTLFRAYPK